MSQFQLPARRDLYYGGGWHQAAGGTAATVSPSTGQGLGTFAVAGAEDVDRAVAATSWPGSTRWTAAARCGNCAMTWTPRSRNSASSRAWSPR